MLRISCSTCRQSQAGTSGTRQMIAGVPAVTSSSCRPLESGDAGLDDRDWRRGRDNSFVGESGTLEEVRISASVRSRPLSMPSMVRSIIFDMWAGHLPASRVRRPGPDFPDTAACRMLARRRWASVLSQSWSTIDSR